MELRTILEERSPEYYNLLIGIDKEALSILPEIRIVFPKYTNHDIAHEKGVENILNEMIPDSIKDHLNPTEIFYLLVATLFHDVGMKLIGEDEEKEFNTSIESDKEKMRENIRNEHHERSSKYIKDNASILNLNRNQADAIADIARAHREINIQEELEDPIHDNRIRLRFLGGLLRVADECHVTEDRVSELFFKTIKSTSWEFKEHFWKHQIITGITFNERNDGKIRIGASPVSEDDEKILNKIKKDILKRLNDVNDLFEENGILLNSVCLETNRNEIIKKKIILNLLDGNSKDSNTISSEINESNIRRNLNELRVETVISQNSGLFCIREEINSFTELIYRFAEDSDNWFFINSNYAQKMIETHLISYLMHKYNVIYIGGELRNRVELLRNSPTAIYLSLKGQDLLNNPLLDLSLIQGDLILDQMILAGLSYDIFKYPISNNTEIKDIIKSINKDTSLRFPELLNFYEEVKKNSERDLSELIDEMNPNDDKERSYSFSIKLNLSNLPEEPNLYAVLNAAMKTGTPIVITGGRILDFIAKEGNEPIKTGKISAIEFGYGRIIPLNIKVKDSECEFKNLHFRRRKIDELSIFSTEIRNFPFKFEFTFNEDKSESFHMEIDIPTANLKQILKFEEFTRAMYQKKKLQFINSKGVITEAEFHQKSKSDSFYELIKNLYYIQKETSQIIKFPENYKLTNEDFKNIDLTIQLLKNGETEIEVDDIKATFKVKELKKIINSIKNKNAFKFSYIHPKYNVKILNENINLGQVKGLSSDLEILELDDINSRIIKMEDTDSMEIKLIPKNNKVKLIKLNLDSNN